MKIKAFSIKLSIRLGSDEVKQTKVAQYYRVRNGKMELVKGYTRKTRKF